MELERTSVELRPRSAWEAMDLGFAMARRHYRSLMLSSLALTVPLFALLALLLLWWAGPFWVAVAFWWLKPLWERTHLFVLSRRLFGEAPAVRDVIREFPRYALPGASSWLTIWRLTPTRSLDVPVTQLEGLRGSDRHRRLRLLRRGDAGSGAFWLMIVLVHVEVGLGLGFVSLAALLAPEGSELDFLAWAFGMGEGGDSVGLLHTVLGAVGAVLVAPFYVSAGFALYLNRRTVLEGWDLEIAFRRLAGRLEDSRRRSAQTERDAEVKVATVLLAWACALPIALSVAPARAQEARENDAEAGAGPSAQAAFKKGIDAEAAQSSIREVLAGDEFHDVDTYSIPRFLYEWQLEADEEPEAVDWSGWESFLSFLATTVEVLLIGALLGLALFLAYRYGDERTRGGARRAREPPAPRPQTLFGLEVGAESLPDDVSRTVLRMWRSGDRRAALALLYRATLSELMDLHGVVFADAFTEGECLRAARGVVTPDCHVYFGTLTRHWQLLAYAHRIPPDAVLEELCQTWPLHFGGSGERDVE